MNNPSVSEPAGGGGSEAQMTSALFEQMILQQANMALMFMGKVPNPETGQYLQEMEAAQLFIDQLEMLEVKTRGNRDRREDALVKQALMQVRMAFVEATGGQPERPPAPAASAAPPPSAAPSSQPARPAASAGETSPPSPPSPAEAGGPERPDQSRKKYVKKY